MVSEQPGLRTCLTLHSLLIPTPRQTSFSGGSSPLGGTLSRLGLSIVCHLTRSRSRPHRDSQLHIQSDLTCLMCRITDDLGGG
ncbi:hypothetical protein PIB30_033461 [Stylosanthes scabra]|uniref:Uncharacterized protein n=1 Tax=Stylosanthes scabra TaxID=79078 RepID=A0ABU6VD97_9FABA|nr:hypothetical protein [Stylosanthes scabra]